MQRILLTTLGCLNCLSALSVNALELAWKPNQSMIGRVQTIEAKREYTFIDLGEWYDFGFNELTKANPDIDAWLPSDGDPIIIPGRFILPDAPQEGIVINLAEYRLYYYLPEKNRLITHPIGIGRVDFPTPTMKTKITTRMVNPTWYPPASVRSEHLREEGFAMPMSIPAGPENPLGSHALKLAAPSYLIHGTNKGVGIGMRVSHGCIRLYNWNIEALLPRVENGTPVNIINNPVKVALTDGKLWIEVHAESDQDISYLEREFNKQLTNLKPKGQNIEVDRGKLRISLKASTGLPEQIGSLQPI